VNGGSADAGLQTDLTRRSIEAFPTRERLHFFCGGTNDLTQATLAAARDDASVNDYYLDSHELSMRLLSIVFAHAGQWRVTLCGELAGREALGRDEAASPYWNDR
jgi:phosphoenolpyruvate-protein kinase (PTS system EI component)